MKIKSEKWQLLVAAFITVGVGICWFGTRRPAPTNESASVTQQVNSSSKVMKVASDEKVAQESEVESEETEEKSEEAEIDPEEAKVEAFDSLVDKWMEPTQREITLEETDEFVRKLHQVPQERREECLQRALNLVPDENVMLLAGVLLDKSFGKDLVELVFNDVLNRDERVKLPILRQVLKDKTHPCYADAAWIMDVTGQGK